MYLNEKQVHALQEALDAMTNNRILSDEQEKDCNIIVDMLNSNEKERRKRSAKYANSRTIYGRK